MKKIIIIAVALLALVACSKKNDVVAPAFVKGDKVTITAGMPTNNAQGGPAKIRSEVGTQIDFYWEQSDLGQPVKVTVGESTAEFTVASVSADGKTATFEGVMPESGTEYTVQYPYDEPTLDSQAYEANNLPKGKMLFRGDGTLGSPVTMNPQYAALKLNLYHDAPDRYLTSLIVELTNDYGYDSIYELVIPDATTIYLGTTEETATSIFLVMPIGSYYIDVEGWVEDDESSVQGSISTSATKTFTAGVCLNMTPALFCLAEGTRITMADGSYKNVEDIVAGDIVRTFDHEAGIISSSKICYTEEQEPQIPLTLNFESGNRLTIVGQHCLLAETTRKYEIVELGNVKSFVGKRFYNAQTRQWDRLTGYEKGKTPVKSYAIYSAYHLNVISENMLTVEDDAYFLLNIYELDENLKADAEQLAADIEKYGLFDVARDYPEFAQYKELLEQLGARYYNIAKGKGLVSQNMIDYILSFWGEY